MLSKGLDWSMVGGLASKGSIFPDSPFNSQSKLAKQSKELTFQHDSVSYIQYTVYAYIIIYNTVVHLWRGGPSKR